MRTLTRNQRKIGLCQRYTANSIDLYRSPIFLYVNYRKTSGGLDVTSFGTTYKGYIKILTDLATGENFHPQDKAYINAEVESDYDGTATHADYEVLDVSFALNQAEILLGRLQNE